MEKTNFYMMGSKKVTNRDLLRNYKSLKEKLLDGEVEEIIVPQKNGVVIKITIAQEETPMERFLRMVDERGPLHIKRPDADFFDFLP